MKKNLLCCALLGAMGFASTAMAQDYDDRWYISGAVGFNKQDNDRLTNDAPFGEIGFGRFLSPNWSLDFNLNYQNPEFDLNQNLRWSQWGGSVDARYHFIEEGRNWWPYIRMGLGLQRAEEEFETPIPPNVSSPGERRDNALALNLGVGLQADYGRVDLRTELGTRVTLDDQSVTAPDEDYFMDLLASVGITVALGPEPAAPVEPAPAQQTCADLDDDGDGVNNCDDKCPGSQAGQTVGPDGCPVPVTIDLRGVNFDFDKSELRPDAVAILNEAIQVLQKYPELKVEVAGHTDAIGTDEYNQGLSERRAQAVYDYLTSNGVDASRLVGPTGYGESRPIAPNENPDGTDNPAGRAENRRTELNVQN